MYCCAYIEVACVSQQNFLFYPAEERVDDALHSYEEGVVYIDHDVDLAVF